MEDPTKSVTGPVRIHRDKHQDRSQSKNLYYYIRLKNNNVGGRWKGKSTRVGLVDASLKHAVPQNAIDEMMSIYGRDGILHDAETTALLTCPDPRYRSIAFLLELAKIKYHEKEWTDEQCQTFVAFWCKLGCQLSEEQKRIFRVSRLVPNPESAVRLTEFDLVGRSAPISHQREGVPPGLDEAVARFSVSGNDISKITIRCPNVKILEIIKPDGPSLLDVNGITYDVGSDDEDAEETKEEET